MLNLLNHVNFKEKVVSRVSVKNFLVTDGNALHVKAILEVLMYEDYVIRADVIEQNNVVMPLS